MEITLRIVLATVSEIIGLVVQAREIWQGRKVEAIAAGFEKAKRLQFLYATQNYKDLLVQSRLDEGDTPARAREWVAATDNDARQAAAEQIWGPLAPELTRALTEWEERMDPKKRNRNLFAATSLQALAAVILVIL